MSLKEYWDSIPESLYKAIRQGNLEKINEHIAKKDKLTTEQSKILTYLLFKVHHFNQPLEEIVGFSEIIKAKAFEFENVEFLEDILCLLPDKYQEIRNSLIEMGADKDCKEKRKKKLIENSPFNKLICHRCGNPLFLKGKPK